MHATTGWWRRKKEKERAQQAEREKANAEKFTAMWKRIRRADWQEGAYSIRAAKSTQELVDEGHAPGNYHAWADIP